MIRWTFYILGLTLALVGLTFALAFWMLGVRFDKQESPQ